MPQRRKYEEIKHAAEKLFATKPDWMKFYREVMGLHGLIRRTLPGFEAMAAFEQTETYREIHRMLAELRKLPPQKAKSRTRRSSPCEFPKACTSSCGSKPTSTTPR